MKIIDSLKHSIQASADYNSNVQVAPVCILWPDKDRQWEAAIPRLQAELPQLFVLGDYTPDKRTGPAIWFRCVIANTINDVTIPQGTVPILYLPGISRQELRAVDSCADTIKPLAELQYRGTLWSQVNAKDWTIAAFLMSDQGGLGFDVAQDTETKNSMQLALNRLLDEDIELLKGKRLDKDYFNTLLMGGDPVKDLLVWLDTGEQFKTSLSQSEWHAFIEVCKSQFAFNPENEGQLGGAVKLANHKGPWKQVWERFTEAPKRYPHIPHYIQRVPPPTFDLFANSITAGGWPQWNEEQENILRQELLSLANAAPHDARAGIKELYSKHGERCDLVWAALGKADLAKMLTYLNLIAEYTASALAAGTLEDLANGYQAQGWMVDQAVMDALSFVQSEADFTAVSSAIRSMYLPWLDASARYLQNMVQKGSYPCQNVMSMKELTVQNGECALFVDGLRYDTAQQLAERLECIGLKPIKSTLWVPLPSITSTGKNAVSPVKKQINGPEYTTDFEPQVKESGQSLRGGYHLKRLLTEAGWKILDNTDNGDGTGTAWCECGDIDHEGHDRGWKLARHLPIILDEITEKIELLLRSGWKRIRVVTDHGWLLMPGGLPKVELPSVLTESKWGRCAVIKEGATTEERLYPWFWNSNVHIALADGISCYKQGNEYTHGGVSLQECLTLELIVENNNVQKGSETSIVDYSWKGLRCKVALEEPCEQAYLDLRMNPGNKTTSIVMSTKAFGDDGAASVIVEDDTLIGSKAFIVITDSNDELLAQKETVIGGED